MQDPDPLPQPPVATPSPMAEERGERGLPPTVPEVLGTGDALRACAICVRERATGSLLIDSQGGVRRILFRDGDVVTAASGVEAETMAAFLVARGDIPRDVLVRLQGKLSAYGRHAGAALVANGYISQDQLWPVLRRHAEWIVGQAMLLEKGTATFEIDPPGRLRSEPSVFGGATGAEVIIEIARRVIPPGLAVKRMGGASTRLSEGPGRDLLAECALPDDERERVEHCRGLTLADIASSTSGSDFATVLYVLVELGVLRAHADVVPLRPDHAPETKPILKEPDPFDAQAIRTRVKARLALIDEGDYFALLGVPRTATTYEIHRAYTELRRAFEPSRMLTAATADLADGLELIVEVLDEAHEILHDSIRRERYRKAIEDAPPTPHGEGAAGPPLRGPR